MAQDHHAGIDDRLLHEFWSYSPFWIEKGYPRFEAPTLVIGKDYVRPAERSYSGNPINESEYIRRLEGSFRIRQNTNPPLRYLNLA